MDLKTAIRITADAQQYLAGLESARVQSLKTFGDLKFGVKQAQDAWKEAEGKVRELAKSLDMETATKKQIKDFESAIKAAGQLKDAYERVRISAAAEKKALLDNSRQLVEARSTAEAAQAAQAQAAAVEDAQRRELQARVAAKAAEAAEERRLAAIVVNTRATMAQAAQDQLAAEKRAFAEAQDAVARYKEGQREMAAQAAARAAEATRLKADLSSRSGRIDAFTNQVGAASPGTSNLSEFDATRKSYLQGFRDLKSTLEPARREWQAAQDEVRNLSKAMSSSVPATQAQEQAFASAVLQAGSLKTRYLSLRDAVHEQRLALDRNAAALSAARTAHDQAAASVDQHAKKNKDLRAESNSLTEQLRLLTLTVAGVFGVGSAREIVDLLDQYGQLNARIKMVSGSYREQADNQRAVLQTAMDNGVAVAGVGQFYVRTAQAVRAYKMEQQNALVVTDLAGKALRINSGTVYGNAAALEQLVQAIGSGRLQGDELRSLSEQAPRLAQAIADGLGVPIGKLKELGSQGALTSQQIIDAIISQRDVITREAERIPLTLSQSAQNVKSALEIYVGGVDKASGVSRGLTQGLAAVARNMDLVVPAVSALTAGLTALAATSAVRMLMTLAVGAGPVALGLSAAAAVATGLWVALAGGDDATAGATGNLRSLIDEVQDFSSNWDEAKREAKVSQLVKGIEQTKAALAGLSKSDAMAGIGATYSEQIQQAEKALEDLRARPVNLRSLIDEVRDFSSNWDEAQRKVKVDQLVKGIEQTKAALAGLSKLDATTGVGAMYREQILQAEKALEDLRTKTAKKPLLLEKTSLGLADAGLAQGTLVDKKQAEALNAFEPVYRAFVDRLVGDDKRLVVSHAEVRRSIANLFGGTKTPEEFGALVATFEKASKLGSSTDLINAIANATEGRRAAEAKAINDQVQGLRTRADQARASFTSMAEQARVAAQLATALDRTRAEVKSDTPVISTDQAARVQAEVQAARASADAQLALLDQVSQRKQALIRSDAAASVSGTDAEIRELQRQFGLVIAKRDEIARAPASEANQARDKKLAEEQIQLVEKGLALRKQAAEEGAAAQANAARKVADVERAAAQERLTIQRELQQQLVTKANEALANYKSYAQQVMALDRQIVNNRLDTASGIDQIKRKDMTPGQQADSLREELQRVREETRAAERDGDKQRQLELLSRQKSVSSELAGVKGDGVDPAALKAEAISNLQRIGDESEAVLKTQRAEAQAAAEQQKATFEALAAAAQRLAVEIGKINAGEQIRLKAEIDTASVQSAVEAVRAAFAAQTFAVKIATPAVPTYGGWADAAPPVARAAGGAIFGPGTATSDSVPAMLSTGEYVLIAAEVRAAGGHRAIYALRAALLTGWMPRFADGGAVGSVMTRLAIPEMTQAANEIPLQPMNVTIPGMGTFPMQAHPAVADDLNRRLAMETLKYGRMK